MSDDPNSKARRSRVVQLTLAGMAGVAITASFMNGKDCERSSAEVECESSGGSSSGGGNGSWSSGSSGSGEAEASKRGGFGLIGHSQRAIG